MEKNADKYDLKDELKEVNDIIRGVDSCELTTDHEPANVVRVDATADPSAAASSSSSSTDAQPKKKPPVCVIFLGMAGSGKTTWVQRFNATLHIKKKRPYVVNLDPAVLEVPYPCNIDIRDSVKYKEVMKQYSLGPNGAIVTSLNLFATRFDQVLKILENRRDDVDYVLIDTPGQIEVFTWSASGSIISETLAAFFPTIVVYVCDTPRSLAPVTFMSNMLYACSIVYRYKLPYIIAMNKVDIVSERFAIEWMEDFEVFQEALQNETSYASGLARSLSLVLDHFYHDLKAVGVSAVTGEGVDKFINALEEKTEYYEQHYRKIYEDLREKNRAEEEKRKEKQLAEVAAHAGRGDALLGGGANKAASSSTSSSKAPPRMKGTRFNFSGMDEENEDDDDADAEEGEEEEIDEEDEEEKKEYESFKRYLAAQHNVD